MNLVFNHRMIDHVNDTLKREKGEFSRALSFASRALRNPVIVFLLGCLEVPATTLLCLPIPVYSSLMYAWITNARGLPRFGGMYLRGLYYRGKLGSMASNVFIDQGVFFAFPKGVRLSEFSFIDKSVIIMSKTAHVGRRVHIAPRVFVSGGGEFEICDYACIATNSNIITSTEVLKDGARCSGPMTPSYQRNVMRSKVRIEKDAFVGANVTILPGVTMAQGSVAGAGITLTRDTQPWGIYVGPKAEQKALREPVRWDGD